MLDPSCAREVAPAIGVARRTGAVKEKVGVGSDCKSEPKLARSVDLVAANQHITVDRWSDGPQELVASPPAAVKRAQRIVGGSGVRQLTGRDADGTNRTISQHDAKGGGRL